MFKTVTLLATIKLQYFATMTISPLGPHERVLKKLTLCARQCAPGSFYLHSVLLFVFDLYREWMFIIKATKKVITKFTVSRELFIYLIMFHLC